MEIKFNLEKRKINVKEMIIETKFFLCENHEQLEKIDYTNKNLLLGFNKSNELLFKNYDVQQKKVLSEFIINKEWSNKESYFYFLNYIRRVQIIYKKEEHEFKIIENNEKKVKPKNIETKENKENIEKNNKEKSYIKITNFNKCLEKKNIKEYFILGEKITLKKFRDKLSEYYKILPSIEEYNKISVFQSELFFLFKLKNIIHTFIESKDDDIKQKQKLISNLSKLIKKIEKNKIVDFIILSYFYFVMDIEIELESIFELKLKDYNEDNYSYKNSVYDKEKNKLIISKKNNDKIMIDDFDLYDLNDGDIEELINGENYQPFNQSFYSIKGLILLRELSNKDGNEIYDKFLPSNLLKDIIYSLYGISKDIFSSNNVIKTFEDNTYYFPIKNAKYGAYTDKECFKIYIDFKVIKDKDFRILNKIFQKFIQKAFLITINIQHEFGHNHKSFLFFIYSNDNCYDSRLTKIILDENNTVEVQEGGEIFEYILYERKMFEIYFKEVIYINNTNNFAKSLKNFRDDFLKLDKMDVNTVFEKEGADNKEISDIYKFFKQLSEEQKQKLENISFKSECTY